VFLLPVILRGLDPATYRLTVAGDGPDRDELLSRLTDAAIPFDAPGLVARADLAGIYRSHDVFLFPSRFEGMPVALSEAMASGMAVVASRLLGITDKTIEDRQSGFLFDQGDTRAAAAHLQALIDDTARLQATREAAYARARDIFSVESMLNAYETAMGQAAGATPIPPSYLSRWRPPAAMGPGLRGLIPAGLRQRLAGWFVYR
jgi:glycosyltransferase involved in cell wall biosynthesis